MRTPIGRAPTGSPMGAIGEVIGDIGDMGEAIGEAMRGEAIGLGETMGEARGMGLGEAC